MIYKYLLHGCNPAFLPVVGMLPIICYFISGYVPTRFGLIPAVVMCLALWLFAVSLSIRGLIATGKAAMRRQISPAMSIANCTLFLSGLGLVALGFMMALPTPV